MSTTGNNDPQQTALSDVATNFGLDHEAIVQHIERLNSWRRARRPLATWLRREYAWTEDQAHLYITALERLSPEQQDDDAQALDPEAD